MKPNYSYDFKKGEKVYFDEVGTGRVKAIFVRRVGTDAIVRRLRKKKGLRKSITLISRRKK